MEEITIKVPAPFQGVADLGFTARYPVQPEYTAPLDVPLLIEGPAQPMRHLVERLRELRRPAAGGYQWTDPVMLSDEVIVMAFRDRSLEGRTLTDGAVSSLGYVANWVTPVVFPFLQDCVRVGRLRLADLIEMRVQAASRQMAELSFRLEQIVSPNGPDLLMSL